MEEGTTIGLWVAGTVCAVTSTFGYLVYYRRFLERLRNFFTVEWQSLGSPTFNEPEGSSAGNALFFYVVSGGFYHLNDPVLNANGKAFQISFALGILAFVVLAFLFMKRPPQPEAMLYLRHVLVASI